MIFPTMEDICEINREWIDRYGGKYEEVNKNLENAAPLAYALTAIQYPIYGVDIYPSLIDKAAALAWWINKGHVFWDGNKRTGMQAAIELLENNKAKTYFNSNSIVEIPLEIADSDIDISFKELSSKIASFVELRFRIFRIYSNLSVLLKTILSKCFQIFRKFCNTSLQIIY